MKRLIGLTLVLLWCWLPSALAEPLQFALVGVEKGTEGMRITQALGAEIAKRSGVELTIEIIPAARAKLLMSHGKIDGDWARVNGYGNDIPGVIKIDEPIASHPYTAYALRDDLKIDGWESLKPYKVSHPRGWKVIELNLEPFHENLFPTNNIEAGLSVVAAGRADVYVNIPFIVEAFLGREGARYEWVKALKPPLDFLHVYIHLQGKHADKAKRMEAALKAMKADGTYQRIMSGG